MTLTLERVEDWHGVCPAGKLLRVRSRPPLRNGNLRICYSAKIVDCRSCPLAQQCIGRNASDDKPRQVSGIRKRVEPIRRPKVAPWLSKRNNAMSTSCNRLESFSGVM